MHSGAKFPFTTTLVALLCALSLTACSTGPGGRSKLVAPTPVSKIYSEVDMQVDLVGLKSGHCPSPCTENSAFRQRVEETGTKLAQATYGLLPETGERIEQFEFTVADKNKPGSTSNAGGKIVIFRGTEGLKPDDAALAFLIAREMGRVIAQHHEENSATRIMISVAAAVLFPASSLFSTTAASQTAYSSTLAATAASTATSLVGSKLALDSMKPEQLDEADAIALALINHLGITPGTVAASLAKMQQTQPKDSWSKELHTSIARIEKLGLDAPVVAVAETTPETVEALPQQPDETFQVALLEPIEEAGFADTPASQPEPLVEPEQSASTLPATTGIDEKPEKIAKNTTAAPPPIKAKKAIEKLFPKRKTVAVKTTGKQKVKNVRVAVKDGKKSKLALKAPSRPSAQKRLVAKVGGSPHKTNHSKTTLAATLRSKTPVKAAATAPKPVL